MLARPAMLPPAGGLALISLMLGLAMGPLGCRTGDRLAAVDHRAVEVMVDLGISNRDATRNVRSAEARQQKARAEEARVALYRDPEVQSAIEAARAHPASPAEAAKAEGYWRDMIVSRPWTPGEKAEEIRLLGKLEEAASTQAAWRSRDGSQDISLSGSWSEVSKAADDLAPAERQALLQEYVDHRMQLVGPDLQTLVTLRNEVAHREGFGSYWELGLASQGLDPAHVQELLDKVTNVVRPIHGAVAARIQAQATADGVERSYANLPWLRRRAGLELGSEQADAYFDGDLAEDRVLHAFTDMGIDTFGWQVYTEPARYARPGVYGYPIRPPDNLAIVMSQDQRWSTWPYEALAHEGGHAVWWRMLSPTEAASPALWGPADPWFEGFAQFFERLVFEPAFTERYVPELPSDLRVKVATWRAGRSAATLSDAIVETLTERRLYEDPSDLSAVASFAAQTRQQLSAGPQAPVSSAGLSYDPALLSSILWAYPAYSQNYLYAGMTEAWMYDAVVSNVGEPVGNPAVGPFIRDRLVRAPAEQAFPDRLAAITEEDRLTALARYLARVQGAQARPPAATATVP